MKTFFISLLIALTALNAFASNGKVTGTFEQNKVLHDLGVTLKSTGTWSFEKDKSFIWNTLKPVPSLFHATPTNYSFTAGGRVTSRSFDMKIDNIAQIFTIKEMKGLVEKVESDDSNFIYKEGNIVIPSQMNVLFKNGDRIEIMLKR
jgi:hypothetical protein